jgi:hypothetical protein
LSKLTKPRYNKEWTIFYIYSIKLINLIVKEVKQMSKYFFCYDSALHRYLHKANKQEYICAAKHETTDKKFWLYERTSVLDQLITQYKTFMRA